MRNAIILGVLLLSATVLAPAASAGDASSSQVSLCSYSGSGLVGIVVGAAVAATCLITAFLGDLRDLTLCVALGGSYCPP